MRDHVRSGTEAVDGLRGIAILLVLFYHTWLFSWFTPEFDIFHVSIPVDVPPRNGYLGVDLFFTISGFVLFFPHALRALAGGPVQTTREYAFRRFIKIVPSYALVLVATAFVSTEYLGRGEIFRSLVAHGAFVHNSFDDPFGRANSVFWSLAIEVQFYVLFPLVARAFRRFPIPTASAMCAVAIAYRFGVSHCCLGTEAVTRQLPAYLDLFAAGMLAAYGVVWLRTRRPAIARRAIPFTIAAAACAWGGFALLQSADTIQYVPLGPQRWDLANRTLVAAAAGGLVLCSCFAVRPWRALLANPVLVFLSVISYNVYLWHTLLMIWMWKHDVPRAATANPHDDYHWKFVYIALGWTVTFLVSTAITYFFERPLLGLVKPHPFAFDWARAFKPARRGVRSETRT